MIDKLMKYWWKHQPEKNTDAVIPKLIKDERTILFQGYDLKSNGAGLGSFIGSKSPRLCIEGITNPDVDIPFIELYGLEDIKTPFLNDPTNDFPSYLANRHIAASTFLFHLYCANEDSYGKLFPTYPMLDLVVVSDTKNRNHGLISLCTSYGVSIKRQVYLVRNTRQIKMADDNLIGRTINSLEAILD